MDYTQLQTAVATSLLGIDATRTTASILTPIATGSRSNPFAFVPTNVAAPRARTRRWAVRRMVNGTGSAVQVGSDLHKMAVAAAEAKIERDGYMDSICESVQVVFDGKQVECRVFDVTEGM